MRASLPSLLLTASLGLAALSPGMASAAVEKPFTPAALAAAQASGQPILVDVFAPWCPTCAAQQPTLSKIETDSAFKSLVVLRVDFDHQKDVLRMLNVQKQSTLIAFHGKREAERTVGDTDPASIRNLATSALK